MKASVVIAAYNGENYLEKQLESITSQTVLPFEVIISDDGSTDGTLQIAERFIKEHSNLNIRFQCVINSAEHGVTANFENAVNHTAGDLVFFCDQDDIWCENKLEKMIYVIENYNVSAAFHNAYILNTDTVNHTETVIEGISMFDQYYYSYDFDRNGVCRIDGRKYLHASVYNGLINGMCLCATRDWLLNIMPFSRGIYHDMWIEFCALADDTVAVLNECLAYYRIHSDNTSGLANFRKKRSLADRLSTFDRKGIESIYKQYVWYTDTADYLEKVSGNSDELKDKVYCFFTDTRINALKQNKVSAISRIISEYRNGSYKLDGKILLLHDMFYILRHSRKSRENYISKLSDGVRLSESQKKGIAV